MTGVLRRQASVVVAAGISIAATTGISTARADQPGTVASVPAAPADTLRDAREVHLRNVRQLTFGGENAEAYWSPDGKHLILQSTRPPYTCDQIFLLDVESGATQLVSTGKGRTTCSYFIPGTDRILYASTHAADAACPPPADHSQGYVWKLYAGFDIYSARRDGSDLQQLTAHPGYDAEATTTTDGSRIVFTSLRDGDLDLYSMKPDGSDVKRLTHTLGYDGGAFYSRDGKHLVWRASRPKTEDEKRSYLDLLSKDMIRPSALEIFVARADGSEARQITANGAANFCPFFSPDGDWVIYASNVADPKGRNFDLWRVRTAGGEPEQITFHATFDGFPMWSPDGKRLVFASNRNARARGETNIFVADWVE
jgi:Tol biopolymer transport system component